jgi:hypothetical protein
MSKKSSSLPTLLKHLAKATERLTDDEIAEVVAGKRRIILTTEDATADRPTVRTGEQPDFGDLIAGLQSAETRDAANRLIDETELTRTQLAQLAKSLDLPVHRGDDTARLREKIIETTIGFRLRSNAIHRKEA